MYSTYPEVFQRDMACTSAQWLHWLPQAVGDVCWQLHDDRVGIRLGDGALGLQWQVVAPRVLGLVQLPRLLVDFRFAGVDQPTRNTFMRRFDLYMQRGGG